jgi:hypothetical protein
MAYVPSRCDTVMIPTGNVGDHLFVITTDACPAGKHLLVNLTSVKQDRHNDLTCILEPGEHPFITQQSYILYRGAQIQGSNRLGAMVDGWVYRSGARASAELTDRILAGFFDSPFTPRFVKNYLAAQ